MDQDSYRTREEEEADKNEPKVRFEDISMSAAFIMASYQAFSPEQIRRDIQNKWVGAVTQELQKSQKFKSLYEGKRRTESRREYYARRQEQVQVNAAIRDLMDAHRDTLFQKGPGSTVTARQTLGKLIDEDYKELGDKRLELVNEVTKAQQKLADGFKEINDKNNARFGKKGLIYTRSTEKLEQIKAEEKAEYEKRKAKTPAPPPPVEPQIEPQIQSPVQIPPIPQVDVKGLSGLLRQSLPSVYESAGSGMSNIAGFLGKLPGLGGFFGGGGAAATATAASTATAATAATGAAATAAGAAGAVAAAPVAVPTVAIIAVATIIILLILALILTIFNNPIAQPYALITPSPKPEPTISLSVTTTPKPPFMTPGENLEEVMQMAADSSCTPLAIIKAISRREATTTWNYSDEQFDLYNSYPWWSSSELTQKTQVCTGFGYNTCTNEIPADSRFGGEYCGSGQISGICVGGAEVMGPMQFERGTWNRYKSQVEEKLSENGITRDADRRVILDAFMAAGLKLHTDSGASSCTVWTAKEIEKAAGSYYDKCIYTIGHGGNYCQEVCEYYNEYSEVTIDCSQVGT